MYRVFKWASDALGVLGVVVCLATGGARLGGLFYVFDAETISIFQGGVGLMVAACLLKLWAREVDKPS